MCLFYRINCCIVLKIVNIYVILFVGILGLGNSDFIAATMEHAARGRHGTTPGPSRERTRHRTRQRQRTPSTLHQTTMETSIGPSLGSSLSSPLLTSAGVSSQLPMSTGVNMSSLQKMMQNILERGRR